MYYGLIALLQNIYSKRDPMQINIFWIMWNIISARGYFHIPHFDSCNFVFHICFGILEKSLSDNNYLATRVTLLQYDHINIFYPLRQAYAALRSKIINKCLNFYLNYLSIKIYGFSRALRQNAIYSRYLKVFIYQQYVNKNKAFSFYGYLDSI